MAAKTTIKVATLTGAAKDDEVAVFTDGSSITQGNLVGNLDVLGNDPGSAKLYSLGQETTGTTNLVNDPTITNVVLASGLSLGINADGTIHFDASALTDYFASLAEGEVASVSFTYTVRMANGALSVATVTVEVEGTNDAPTMAPVEAVHLEDTAENDSFAPVTGKLIGQDVDHGAVLTYGFDTTQNAGVSGDGLSCVDPYGTLTLDPETGEYSFAADAEAANALRDGEEVTVSFVVHATDEYGASSDPRTISFVIHGANDTAEITVVDTSSGSLTEDGGVDTVGGSLKVEDRDTGESVFAEPEAAALTGTYGSFSFDAATGAWSYTLDNDAPATQTLELGETAIETLTVASIDGTASQTITVTIHGAADAPPAPLAPLPFTGTGDPNDHDDASGTPNNVAANGDNIVVITNPGTTVGTGNGNDTIYGSSGPDTINGGNHDDVIYGEEGDDDLLGQNHSDTIYGGSGDDLIAGGEHGDVIYGGSGMDTINGDGGADTIYGGYGADVLSGGDGADIFWYLDSKDTGDVITDFAVGTDRLAIALPGFDVSDVSLAGSGGDTRADIDLDADDGVLDLQITLQGVDAGGIASAADLFLIGG